MILLVLNPDERFVCDSIGRETQYNVLALVYNLLRYKRIVQVTRSLIRNRAVSENWNFHDQDIH
jgi:hypothetical protein